MELIIDIPDELYEEVKNLPPTTIAGTIPSWIIFKSLNVIRKGTKLPKGHGRLIDYDSIKSNYLLRKNTLMSTEERMDLLCGVIDNAPAVIEADKEKIDADSD